MTGTFALWRRAFLEERPSINLSLFRLAVAFTVGAHVIPTLLHLEDNYLSTAFREKNPSFFPINFLIHVDKSPDALVLLFAGIFYISLAFLTLGLFSQISCIVMTLSCYYFYALNSAHIGTLSWDILLVTLFLMCVTGFHGDYFSLDALRKPEPHAYRKVRPYFLQRLLQLQLASTYFYTALGKVSAHGNWIHENPIYYLVNSTDQSVVKHFPLRGLVAQSPELSYVLGISIIVMEFTLPFLLFIHKTRAFAIAVGIFFQVMLVVTLHVPTIFFFLFTPMFLLFIEPEKTIDWVEKIRRRRLETGRDKLLYDGKCGFCVENVKALEVLDLFGRLEPLDFQSVGDLKAIHRDLTHELCHSEIQLISTKGKLYGGFFAFRYLTQAMPTIYPLAPVFHLPGMARLGTKAYALIAKNRYLLHRRVPCADNRCFR